MLSLSKVKDYLREAFTKAGYNFDDYNIEVSFNGRLTRTLGRCKYRITNDIAIPYAIEFSKQLIETSTDKSVIDVIYHEAAHALVEIETGKGHGHDLTFKQMCARIGTTNDGTCTKNLERTVDEAIIYKYFIICKNCGKVVGKYQRAGKVVKYPHLYNCKCGGSLSVIQNF